MRPVNSWIRSRSRLRAEGSRGDTAGYATPLRSPLKKAGGLLLEARSAGCHLRLRNRARTASHSCTCCSTSWTRQQGGSRTDADHVGENGVLLRSKHVVEFFVDDRAIVGDLVDGLLHHDLSRDSCHSGGHGGVGEHRSGVFKNCRFFELPVRCSKDRMQVFRRRVNHHREELRPLLRVLGQLHPPARVRSDLRTSLDHCCTTAEHRAETRKVQLAGLEPMRAKQPVDRRRRPDQRESRRFIVSSANAYEEKFRISSSGLFIPYISAPVNLAESLMIVTVGLNDGQDTRKRDQRLASVERLLSKYSLVSSVRVLPSAVPFRGL